MERHPQRASWTKARRALPGLSGLIGTNRLLIVALLVFTIVTLAPGTPVPAAVAPGARVALETSRFLVTFATAGLLAGLGGAGERRAGFIAALVLLGITDLAFGVVPNVVDLPGPPTDTILPWVTARYLAGIMFVLVGLERPRWPLKRVVAVSISVYVLVEVTVILLLPSPAPLGLDPSAPVPTSAVTLELVPMVLFGFGAVLASRLYERDRQPLDRWLAASLMVGVFTQVHEAAFPVGLGQVVSSADLLRAASAALLLVGAVQQVAQLRADRTRALALSQADLRELRVVSDTLQEYVAQEASFRSVVTHELATPVATIAAYAHVLQAARLPPPSDEAVRTIAVEARRLGSLIERMDELSAVDTDTLAVDPRPVAIGPLLAEAAAFGRAVAGSHPVTVRAEDAVLPLDPTRVSQVLRNLVGNAARYSPSETPIRLSGRRLPDGYEVLVEDEGPGFGVADAQALFTKYRRGPAGAGIEGTGLGLWIVREIVREHGGSVTIVQPGERGGRVRLLLPLQAPRTPHPRQRREQAPDRWTT